MTTIPQSWVQITWNELKLRSGKLDYLGKSSDYDQYYPYKTDGGIVYCSSFYKSYYQEENSDCKDFYDNYKSMIDEYVPEVNTQNLPLCCQTYFCGSGDTNSQQTSAIGAGESASFKVLFTDSSKSKTIQFNDDFYLVSGYFSSDNAPFGARADVEILDNNDNVVGCFCKKIPIFGDRVFYLENDNRGFISKYYKIKITIFNSDPENFSDHEIACTFRCFACLKMYRKNPYAQ